MLQLRTMLLPTGEFALVLSGEEVAGIDDDGLQAFTRFKEAVGAAAGLAVPHDIEIEDAFVQEEARRREHIPESYQDLGYVDGDTYDVLSLELARRHEEDYQDARDRDNEGEDYEETEGLSHDQHAIPPSFVGEAGDRVTDFFGVQRDAEEFVDAEGFTPDCRDYEGPPLTYDNVLNGFDMDAKARSSASGAVADLDAYVGTLDGASTPVTGQLVASTDGWDSGDRLIETDLGPLQGEADQALVKLQEAGLWPAGLSEMVKLQAEVVLPEVVWTEPGWYARGGEDPRACPCYSALDGGQGEEARLQDEACVAEYGRCDDCPTLQP